MAAKTTIKFATNLEISPAPLPGTAEWLMKIAHEGTVNVCPSKQGRPAVFLQWVDANGDKRSECLAVYGPEPYHGEIKLDYAPFADFYRDYNEFGGVALTAGGVSVLKCLGRKAKTLLKYRLRKGDKVATQSFKLALTPAGEQK